MRIKREKNFIPCFNERTGEYLRTGILENGKDTGTDPFMAEFPELLDVGIMGHCRHGQEGLCLKAGVQCCQDGLHVDKPNMTLENFAQIAKQCRGKTFQFALGGCGDPDQHEDFSYTLRAQKMLIDAGVKTNVHYVLSRSTVGKAAQLLKNACGKTGKKSENEAGSVKKETFPAGINAVIFLLHMPVGLGKKEEMITSDNGEFWRLLRFIDEHDFPFKIGSDSCHVPALLDLKHVDMQSIDTCEGGRWSAYISSDLKMMPCSRKVF